MGPLSEANNRPDVAGVAGLKSESSDEEEFFPAEDAGSSDEEELFPLLVRMRLGQSAEPSAAAPGEGAPPADETASEALPKVLADEIDGLSLGDSAGAGAAGLEASADAAPNQPMDLEIVPPASPMDLEAQSLDAPTEPASAGRLLLSIGAANGVPAGLRLRIRPRYHAPGTALVFDERMCLHRNPIEDHPERPERITELYTELCVEGLAAHARRIPARLVTREEVSLVHEVAHWDRIESVVRAEAAALHAFAAKHESVYLNEHSMDAARLAAGSVIQLAEAIMTGTVRNGLAIVRPPGHHAEVSATWK